MKKAAQTSKAFTITIDKLVYGGAGIGRHQGKVVFVPFSVPGDQLLVRPAEVRKTFVRAETLRMLKPGVGRATPICPHFGKCGGCHWQQLEYERQVETKRQILEEIFHHRIPQTRDLPITMRACPQPLTYRSRARLQLRGSGSGCAVGFYRHASHVVEDVESCPLFRKSLNEALSSLRQFKLKVDTDGRPQEIDMACSEEEDTWATARIASEVSHEGITPLVGSGRNEEVILRRKVGDFYYSVTASVFFQANDFMVSELAALVKELARSVGSGSALDLFAGVGLYTLPLARQFAEIIAVENSPPACRLCAGNAKAAGLGHIQIACADALSWMESQKDIGRPEVDLIVLNPPRAGAGSSVMQQVRAWAPKTIIYVSCDPQTLLRDLTKISPREYRIDHVEGLDMFPQTYHFETVARLVRN